MEYLIKTLFFRINILMLLGTVTSLIFQQLPNNLHG